LPHAVRERALPHRKPEDPISRPAVKTRIHAEDGEFPFRLGLKAPDNLLEKSAACKRTSLNVAQLRQVLPFPGRIFAGIAGLAFMQLTVRI
jgi:hypothetical protein